MRELKKYYIVWLLNIKNQLWFYHEVIGESKLEYIIIDSIENNFLSKLELDSSFAVSTYNKHGIATLSNSNILFLTF